MNTLLLTELKMMNPKITVVTLGVSNLEAAFRFYSEGLGFPSKGIIGTEFEHGAVAFFDLESGLKLAVWPRKSMSFDSGIPLGQPNPGDFSLGHNVATKEEVDQVLLRVGRAGGTIVKSAHETFWGGYSGYFLDPDEHLWEVVWNPHLLPNG